MEGGDPLAVVSRRSSATRGEGLSSFSLVKGTRASLS